MGTLTQDCPRLDTHCPHKLPTSCRLTSTPNCCACADERPHSRTYRVYIDGVGYVQRGTRWQSYCWFCKEFWTNRVACTDPFISTAQTQIPHIPSQDEFVAKWFEFHQGYRTVRHPDGREQRLTLLAEPFSEVNPGHLPRTFDQLRRGTPNNNRRRQNRFTRPLLAEEIEEGDTGAQQTLDEALDSLLEDTPEAAVGNTLTDESVVVVPNSLQQEDEQDAANDTRAETPLETPQSPDMPNILTRHFSRTDRAQRARDRMIRVFGTREEIQEDDYQSPISDMYNRAWDRYRRAEEFRSAEEPIFTPQQFEMLTDQERHEIQQQILWGVNRNSLRAGPERTPDTPRDVPVPSTAGARHPSVPEDPMARDGSGIGASTIAPHPSIYNLNPGPIPDHRPVHNVTGPREFASGSETPSTATLRHSLEEINEEVERLRNAATTLAAARQSIGTPDSFARLQSELARMRSLAEDRTFTRLPLRQPSVPAPTLDNQPDRPPGLTDEEMTRKLACQVCYSQVADIAVLPCGHMVMCQWCADVVVPVKHNTVPTRSCACPMCRKAVRSRVKIHIG